MFVAFADHFFSPMFRALSLPLFFLIALKGANLDTICTHFCAGGGGGGGGSMKRRGDRPQHAHTLIRQISSRKRAQQHHCPHPNANTNQSSANNFIYQHRRHHHDTNTRRHHIAALFGQRL
ncbi:hypothetical protein niasHT_012582 [Heterodera trifolii]|uniref:Secreted protein n=1 Tax=Heterodera trifolii TaxID=157864 RepID=A0ABD2L1C0_9BILA